MLRVIFSSSLGLTGSFGQTPTLPVWAVDVGVRLGAIGETQVLRIPQELGPGPQGHVPQDDGLGQGTGIIEIGGGRLAALTGLYPLLMVTDGPLQGLGRPGVGLVYYKYLISIKPMLIFTPKDLKYLVIRLITENQCGKKP